MQDNIERIMYSLVTKVNKLALELNTKEYDAVLNEEYQEQLSKLIELEEQYPEQISPNSPSKRGGGKINESVHLHIHPTKLPRHSLAHDEGAVTSYLNLVTETYNENSDAMIYTSPRLRLTYTPVGLTLVLHYKNGELIKAVTKGDSEQGEVVTDNARTIINLPHYLYDTGLGIPDYMEVIGEATVSKYTLERINAGLVAEGRQPLTDCANAATSALRQHDSSVTASRSLIFYARDIINIIPSDAMGEIITQEHLVKFLEESGFDVTPARTNNGIDNLVLNEDIFHVVTDMVKHGNVLLPFEFDGIMIDPELLMIRRIMRDNLQYPIVYLFPDLSTMVPLDDVTWELNEYGYYRPIGHVTLNGVLTPAKITSVRELVRMGLSNKSIVKVISGKDGNVRIVDAIPGFDTSSKPYEPPLLCQCGSPTLTISDEYIKCTNASCHLTQMVRLKYFRDMMGITSITDDMLVHLYSKKIITRMEDFFDPKLRMKLDSWNEGFISQNHVNTILKNIDTLRNTNVSRVINALGIEHVREATSKLIARYFPNIKSFMLLETGNLSAIPGISEVAATSIRRFINDDSNLVTLVELDKYLKITDDYAILSNNLFNTSWVILGELDNLAAIMQLINMHGGMVTKSITSGTTHALVGRNPPSDKLSIVTMHDVFVTDVAGLGTLVG